MLSILIPTYNYNIYALVENVYTQLKALDIVAEIIVSEDNSSSYIEINREIVTFSNTKYLLQNINLGRTKNREALAKEATYDWLLFLDADIMPATSYFVKDYIDAMQEHLDVLFGGIQYQETAPSTDKYLRWYYGKHRESQSIEKRNQQPWFIISQNLLIKKELFYKANISKENRYGLDNLFSNRLKMLNAQILHIDNPVIHLGLETNTCFLKKTLDAVETTIYYEDNGLMEHNLNGLQKSYTLLKKRRISKLFLRLIRPFKSKIRKNLIGKSPSLFLFDLYKLQHYTSLKKNKDA
ncbi:glycosyltransferase [uncultured Dokdonia sp.]|uniref:glycosyltransferase family 2 protein n=1 Tax=uncultured Dokdonia sp. TaxID=575653 RepID=UPI00261971C2|nr:glycosyltransferase [uncultured Dokdonia sp.]